MPVTIRVAIRILQNARIGSIKILKGTREKQDERCSRTLVIEFIIHMQRFICILNIFQISLSTLHPVHSQPNWFLRQMLFTSLTIAHKCYLDYLSDLVQLALICTHLRTKKIAHKFFAHVPLAHFPIAHIPTCAHVQVICAYVH